MSKKLFVSNLNFDITQEELFEIFSEVGSVVSAVIATDRETKRSKGFAFVEMADDDIAESAIDSLNNRSVGGRPIKVVQDRGKGGSTSPQEGGRKFEPLPPIQRMQLFRRRKKVDPFLIDPNKRVDYRDVDTLTRFLSERGRILSQRLTGLSAYNQRKVKKAIKRSQNLGLIPFAQG
jgi:ribosomal protein S18